MEKKIDSHLIYDGKIIKVYKDTVLERFPLYCPKCKQEMLISVRELNTSIIEPDAQTQSR